MLKFIKCNYLINWCWKLPHIGKLCPKKLVYELKQPLHSLSIDFKLDALTIGSLAGGASNVRLLKENNLAIELLNGTQKKTHRI